ncbi:hypothetical protein F5X98DRAFT_372207 [Xylaria grammica]|nr:hypothetical protein F5X98DRAFT_372207 [Xylaria grammica]
MAPRFRRGQWMYYLSSLKLVLGWFGGLGLHWSLVLKDSTKVDLLDANDPGGLRKHEVSDFTEIRKNHLKIICEVANLGNEELARLVRTTAAAEKIPTSEDGYFCRTWVINVLESLQKNHVELYDDPSKRKT